MHIGAYFSRAAEFRVYDPAVVGIAEQIGMLIQGKEPKLKVEHVGSTAVPDCGGKGIIDLAVLYPEGLLARAKAVLDELSFHRQSGPEPFPEARPMRVGCVRHKRRRYRVHAHVLALGSEEHEQMVWFRDALRCDAALKHSYEVKKQAILEAGIQDALGYCKAKGVFVAETLTRRRPPQRSSPLAAPCEQSLPAPCETLSADQVRLQFVRIVPGEPARGFVSFYHFRILAADGTEVGHINFRVGDTEHVRVCAGHIGFQISEPFRGHGYALQACRALAPLVASIYQAVTITCDPDNHACRRTLEHLGARFIDEVTVPPHDPHYQRGSRCKRRYRWEP